MARNLTEDELRRRCGTQTFAFRTTDELAPQEGIIGQERALDAIEFGLNLRSLGFNIYVLGDSGTGRTSAIRSFISQKARGETMPPDWCYVFNFADPAEPIAISLEPGQGSAFRKDMQELVAALKVEFPKVFESKEYKKQKNVLSEEFQKRQKEVFGSLEQEAEAKRFAIRATMGGFTLVALTESAEPLTEEAYNALSPEEKERIRANGKQIQEKVDDAMRALKKEEKATDEKVKALERSAALSVLGPMLDDVKDRFPTNAKLLDYLDAAGEDILSRLEDFKASSEEQASPPVPFLRMHQPEPDFSRYSVNVLVSNAGGTGSPCVFESNPTYSNIFGRIEYRFQLGAAMTDFTMIKAGSLHKANGGYLVINAIDLLRNLFSYDALKRAIKNGEVKIEDPWEQYRVVTTAAMKPAPIPMNAKVILIGNPEIYHLLYNLDEEYRELFKVKADFDNRMDRSEDNVQKYAGFVARKAREERLLPFDPSGVAIVVEHGSRLAEHQEKLSAKFSDISNLLREAHFWASKDKAAVVSGKHVEKALEERIHRHGRVEDRLREVMADGTLIVETSGEKAGQVNGLAVIDMGDYSFGKPSRITAAVYAGKAGVVNIERETKLSGKIHEKAVLILTNYMGRRYAARQPLSLTASIAFEQLYGMIEGDSATCAELYSLLSAIAGVPLRQDMAVTGSMDQNGSVQPVGGLNEKIEGFYELCRVRGLTGTQGVVIPGLSVRSLMLKKDVVDAVREGKFRIHAIDRVEEGIEILTGMTPGEQDADGRYPEGTFNRRVADRLAELRKASKEEKEPRKKPPAENNSG